MTWVSSVEIDAMSPPQNPPNNIPAARWITKEVEPAAPKWSGVLVTSTSEAARTNVQKAHRPGKGARASQADHPTANAPTATRVTRIRILVLEFI